MATSWKYKKDGKEHGPISSADLKRLADSGAVAPYDLVQRNGEGDWYRASAVSGLFSDQKCSTHGTTTPIVHSNCPPSSAVSLNPEWRYKKDGRVYGPVSAEMLKALASTGKIQSNDLVAKVGHEQYREASTVRGLFESRSEAGVAREAVVADSARSGNTFASGSVGSSQAVSSGRPPEIRSESAWTGLCYLSETPVSRWFSVSSKLCLAWIAIAGIVLWFTHQPHDTWTDLVGLWVSAIAVPAYKAFLDARYRAAAIAGTLHGSLKEYLSTSLEVLGYASIVSPVLMFMFFLPFLTFFASDHRARVAAHNASSFVPGSDGSEFSRAARDLVSSQAAAQAKLADREKSIAVWFLISVPFVISVMLIAIRAEWPALNPGSTLGCLCGACAGIMLGVLCPVVQDGGWFGLGGIVCALVALWAFFMSGSPDNV